MAYKNIIVLVWRFPEYIATMILCLIMKYYINSYVTNIQIVEHRSTIALALVRSGQILLIRKEINALNISRFDLAFKY